MTRRQQPVFLDLTKIKMPIGALVSIGHRISGVVLALSVPFAIWVLALSLRDDTGFAQVQAVFARPGVKGASIIAIWALAHHVLAGTRHLLSDFNIGSPLRAARRSAWFIYVAGVVIAIVGAGTML